MKTPGEQENRYSVPALERGLKILELLSGHLDGLTLSGMTSLGVPRASLYRMLMTLVGQGYVTRDEHEVYRLGRKLLKLGCRALDDLSLTEQAMPWLRELRDQTGETALLGELYQSEGVVLSGVPSLQAVCVYVRIGHHFPLHTAAPGKALLAALPEAECAALLPKLRYMRFTDRTLTTPEALSAELAEVRRTGVAFDRGEELPELRCVGSAVLDETGYPVAAVWLAGPESRLSEERLQKLGELVKQMTGKIQNRS